MPRAVVIGGVVVIVGLIGWVWFRNRQARAQNAASAGAATSAGGGIDWSGPVSTLQTEVIDLQSSVSEIEKAQDEQERDLRGFSRWDRREDRDRDDMLSGGGADMVTPTAPGHPSRHHHHHRRKIGAA
jgi:hypothetical protein